MQNRIDVTFLRCFQSIFVHKNIFLLSFYNIFVENAKIFSPCWIKQSNKIISGAAMQICLLQNLHIFPAFLQNIIREIPPYSIPSSLTIKKINCQRCPVVVLILNTDYTVFYTAYAAFVTKKYKC